MKWPRPGAVAQANAALRGRLLRACVVAAAMVLPIVVGGCATAGHPDPLEPWNRKVFAFNEGLDDHVLKPTAKAYQATVPAPVRTAATNFFSNVYDLWSAFNLFLQGRVEDGLSDVMRFGSNTVFGMLGFADVASEMGLERHNEDLGQTLGHWGVGPGAYIVWPLFGPSSLRDSLGLPIETAMSAETWVSPVRARNMLTLTHLVNTRANLLQASGMLDDIALDKYTFVRDGYLQRRRNLVYDGDPPETPNDSDDDERAPMPPSAGASEPAK